MGTVVHNGRLRSLLLRLDYLVYPRIIVPAVGLLHPRIAYGLAILRGDLRHSLDRVERERVSEGMELFLGAQLSEARRDSEVRNFFRIESCEKIDAMRLYGDGRKLTKLVRATGLEHLKDAIARGTGAIVCSAHIGSSKCSFSIIGARGFPITVIGRWSYERDEDEGRVRRLINRLRIDIPVTSHFAGPNIVPRPGNLGVAVQAVGVLRRNGLVGIEMDSKLKAPEGSRPVDVEFMGRRISLAPGAVTMAKLTGAPLLMMFLIRSKDWRHQELHISPPVDQDESLGVTFRKCLSAIEEVIISHPGHWRYWRLGHLTDLGLLDASELASKEEGKKSQLTGAPG